MNNEVIEVKVRVHGGGWYSYSSNGHAFYNRMADILVRGIESLKSSMISHNCWAVLDGEYIGKVPEDLKE